MKKQLVIIPGWGGTKESWQKFSDMAEADFEVHCLELPCFGENPYPKEVWGVDEYADYVAKEIEELDKPIILGHSFGGQVAVNLVARKKDVCSQLILSGAAVLRPEKKTKKACFRFLAKIGKSFFSLPGINKAEKLAKKVLYKIADSPDYNKTDGIKREIFQKITRQSQKEKLQDIMVQTLVVWGENDSYVPLEEGKLFTSIIKNSKLEIVKNGRHGLHINNTEELLKIIKDFTGSNVI